MARLSVEERFTNKVNKTSSCWLWEAALDVWGYGMLNVEGKTTKAHRLSYQIYKGYIPEGLLVCHSCDIPACVNPDHLWLGTSKDNAQDRDTKGRHYRKHGTKNPNCKLTQQQVLEIKEDPRVYREIRDTYKVSMTQISRIKRGETWVPLELENTNTSTDPT